MSENHYARIADLYDGFVHSDYDHAFFIEQCQGSATPILELMAGTGRLTIPLIEAGFAMTAIDFSGDMLDVLRAKLAAKALQAELHQKDVRNFDLGQQFDRIILPFQAFLEITEPADQQRALQAIHRHLSPDGVFICTLHNPFIRRQHVNNQLVLAGRQPWADGGEMHIWLLQKYVSSQDEVEVLEFFELYDRDGLLISKRYSSLRFHLLEQDAFAPMIDKAGFELVKLFGNYDSSPFVPQESPFMIWVLRRRS